MDFWCCVCVRERQLRKSLLRGSFAHLPADAVHGLLHEFKHKIEVELFHLLPLAVKAVLQRHDVAVWRLDELAHDLKLAILEALILENLFYGDALPRLDNRGLEDDAEGAIADNALCGVADGLCRYGWCWILVIHSPSLWVSLPSQFGARHLATSYLLVPPRSGPRPRGDGCPLPLDDPPGCGQGVGLQRLGVFFRLIPLVRPGGGFLVGGRGSGAPVLLHVNHGVLAPNTAGGGRGHREVGGEEDI